MKFAGFPARMDFTPVPSLFLSQLAPALGESELRLMLVLFNIMYSKKGYLRCVSEAELAAHPGFLAKRPAASLGDLLSSLCAQEVLLPLALTQDGASRQVYFLNTPAEREAREKLLRGEVKLAGATPAAAPVPAARPLPDIFTFYEENVELLTPIVADKLKDALATYPESWLREAITEAVSLNKRSLRYIERILERWHTEGKGNGTHQPHNTPSPDKFVSGRYGKLVQR
jgi:DNA replication protein